MFFPIRFKAHVQLVPQELDINIEKTLMTKLKKRYEGVCSRFGYIKPDTLQILHRSLGSFMKPHFNGHTRFEVLMVGEVCNPTQGMVVTAKVQAKNNLGILAESSVVARGLADLPLLDIIVPRRSAGIASEVDLDTISVGEEVFVEVLGKRYQLNDTKISIIGRIVKERRGVPANETNDVIADTGGETETEFDDDVDADDVDVDGDDPDGEGDDDEDETKPAKANEIADAKRFALLLRESAVKAGGAKVTVDGDEVVDEDLEAEIDEDEEAEDEEEEEDEDNKEWE